MHNIQAAQNWRRAVTALLSVGLVACAPSEAQAPQPITPSAEQIAAAYHPSYQSKAGSKSECLGRLVFGVSKQVPLEWGLPSGATNEEALGFSRILQGGQDSIHLGNIAVVIIKNASLKTILELKESVQMDKEIGVNDYDTRLSSTQSALAHLNESIRTPEIKNAPKELAAYQDSLNSFEKELLRLQQEKADLEKDWHPTDWGVANSTGYLAGSALYAFIYRNGYAFQFLSTGGEGEAPYPERLAAFKKLLSNFSYRPMYQIPDQPGLCIPHGFIADDGQGHFSAEVSYRYTDSPSVIYTVGTAITEERDERWSNPILEATARSTVAGLIGGANGRKLKTLGPSETKLGARPGMLGGMYTTTGIPGYSVYAGLTGWSKSRELPSISLNMRSFDRSIDPETIKVDPPAFSTSKQRFDETLASIRTRKGSVNVAQ